MEIDNVLEKEHLLVDCRENGWKLFVQEFSKLKGLEGIKFRNEILGRLTKPRNFSKSLDEVVRKKQEDHPGLSNEDARTAVMTENGIVFGILKSAGIETSQPYTKTIMALNADLPWNKTGFNKITVRQLNVSDLEEASSFIKSKL